MRTGCSLKGRDQGVKEQNTTGRAETVPARGPVPQHPSKVSRTGPRVESASAKHLDPQASPW